MRRQRSDESSLDPDEDAARKAALAIIERGDAAPSPLPAASAAAGGARDERMRRLAIELGRSVDA